MGVLEFADKNWGFLNKLMHGHVALYRSTRGLIGHRVPFAPPMLLVDHVGAKTGTRRTSALAYLRDGENLVIVASKGGHPKHPAWYHNLRANPDTTVQVGAEVRKVRARVANPHEHEALWPKVVERYKGFDTYQERTGREIPLVILEPRTR
jgi:deazaflavin-dependent oxidoreductase (nitroreductase family)